MVILLIGWFPLGRWMSMKEEGSFQRRGEESKSYKNNISIGIVSSSIPLKIIQGFPDLRGETVDNTEYRYISI